jgi:hypothetical protein
MSGHIAPPLGVGVFEFVILSKLRAAQLMRGAVPRVVGPHKHIVIAQLEVSTGRILAVPPDIPA